MRKGMRYPVELRERAVRLVLEHREEYPSEWAAILSISQKRGMGHETLRKWVRPAYRPAEERPDHPPPPQVDATKHGKATDVFVSRRPCAPKAGTAFSNLRA